MVKKCFITILIVFLIALSNSMIYAQYSRQEVEKKNGIKNCHSFTYWQLTGEVKGFINYQTLEALLKNKYLYKEINLPSYVDYDKAIELEAGDVVTFGQKHSGYVISLGRISHFRVTLFHTILTEDHTLLPNAALIIPIEPENLWGYPHDYIAYLRKQGISQEEIDKKLYANPPTIGFYHPADTIKEIKSIPAYSDFPVTVWKQPKKMEIYPPEQKITEDGKAYFKARLIYEKSSEIIDADKLTSVFWLPDFVDEGVVSGSSAGVGKHQIRAEATKIPKPWGLYDKFVQESYAGRLFHSKYEAAATLIVEEKVKVSQAEPDVNGGPADNIIGNWCRSGHCVQFYKTGADTYAAKITEVGPLEPYHFKANEVTFRNIKYIGDGKYKGEVSWRWTDGGQRWEPVNLALNGDIMEGVGTWVRQKDTIS
jgi:hypothetical protein